MGKITDNEEFFGEYISEWKPEHKNAYVISGMIQGKECIADNRVGRVAQVRLEAGDFGSHCVLLRHVNDVLTPHENQSFWLIPDRFKDYLDGLFKDTYMDDSDKYYYTLQKKKRQKGFIVSSKIKVGQSTPMRDIKAAISSKIHEIVSNQTTC